jgi:hypothetical protein
MLVLKRPLQNHQPDSELSPEHFVALLRDVIERVVRFTVQKRFALQIAQAVGVEDQRDIKTAKLGQMELYNLKADRAETRDRAGAEPKRLAQMTAQMKKIYVGVQKDTPQWPAWEFARYEGQRIQWPPFRGARKVEPRKPKIPGDFRSNPLHKRP